MLTFYRPNVASCPALRSHEMMLPGLETPLLPITFNPDCFIEKSKGFIGVAIERRLG